MTPAELLALADAALPGPWIAEGRFVRSVHRALPLVGLDRGELRVEENARLIALAPDLARLCAEMGEALEAVRDAAQEWGVAVDYEWLSNRANAALAKLSELEART